MDPDVAAAICENLHIGMPLDLAAEAEGIGRTTVHDWMRRFPDFLARVTRARSEGAKTLHLLSLGGVKVGEVLTIGAGKAQQVALMHLALRFPEFYRAPKDDAAGTEVKITIEGGLPRE